ncbi:MAG: T9SS type A sorting domain-containing protein [Bacteroidetes bacterium]|nr:T9SS type A sorting domain-containing protein [Bacteroidota bacterium]
MKKAILLSFLLAMVNIGFGQGNLIFYENFDSTARPTGWDEKKVVGNTSGSQVNWQYTNGGYENYPEYPAQGIRNAMFQSDDQNASTKLITPAIDLSDAAAPELKFSHVQQVWEVDNVDYWDRLKVYYKRGLDSSWVLLEEYLNSVADWTERSILLPDSSLSSTYYIAFEGISGRGWGTCIDTMRIIETIATPKYVDSYTINQASTTFIPTGTQKNPILYITFNVKGNTGNLYLDSLKVTSLNSNDNDIANNGVKLFTTEDSIFNNPVLIPGAEVSFENGTANFQNIGYDLPRGKSTLWITYDIVDATDHDIHNHVADAKITTESMYINGYGYPFSDKSPGGQRLIKEAIFSDSFESLLGWELNGSFEIAEPQGLGGGEIKGFNDPEEAYAGSNVLGTDLTVDGAYAASLGFKEDSAVSPNFNCLYYKDVNLYFERWLNNEYADLVWIDISNDNKNTWVNLWSGVGADDAWKTQLYNLDEADFKENVSIRYALGITNATNQYTGWNIDNFIIIGDFISKDVGITEITLPKTDCGHTASDNISVYIENYAGETSPSSIPLKYEIDGSGYYETDTFTASSINLNDSAVFTFSVGADLSEPGPHTIKVQTALEGDEIASNNSLTKTIFSFPTYTLPYAEDFETNYGYYLVAGKNETWGYGVPSSSQPIINTAASGTKAWVTNLNGPYPSNDSTVLITPCFDFTGTDSIIFEFKCLGYSDEDIDGLTVMYSTDQGSTWDVVPDDNDYYWNWYNKSLISTLGLPGWDNTDSEWKTYRQLLPPELSDLSSVKFQFVFESDASANFDGFGIDDIKVYEAPADVGVSDIVNPYTACEWSDATNVTVTIENYGMTTLDTGSKIPVGLDFQGSLYTIDTLELITPLAPEGTIDFTFTETIDMSNAGDYDLTAYTLLEADPYFYNETVCNDSISETVTVQGMPNYNPFPEFIGVDAGSSISELLDAGAGYDNYAWSTTESSPTITATSVGIYSVTVTKNASPANCTAEDEVDIIGSTTDITVNSILTTLDDSCEITERTQLTELSINITNSGLADLTAVDDTIFLAYKINELPMVEDTLIDPGLAQTASTDFTFKQKCDLRSAGQYNIKVFHNFPQDLNPADDTAYATINTWKYPEVSLAYDTIYSSQADTITLDAGAGFATYLWNPGDSITQTITPINSSYYYHVTVTDVNGCGSDKDSTYIETHDLGITNIISPVDICYDDISGLVNLNVEVTNFSDSIYTSSTQTIYYEYDGGDPVEINPSISVDAYGTTVVNIGSIDVTEIKEHTLKVYTSSEIDANHDNDSYESVFNTWPEPDVELAYDTIFTTQPDTVILVAQEGFAAYSWSDGSSNDTLDVSDLTSKKYIVTVTSANGCGTDEDSTQIIAYNFGITELLKPTSDCEHSSSETVKISVKNYGEDIITSGTEIPVGYILNNNSPVIESISLGSDLNPGETTTYSFSTKIDLSTIATYNVKVFSAFELDAKTSNDTIADVIKTYGYPSVELGEDILTTDPESVVITAPTGYNYYLWNDGTTTNTLSVTYPASKLYSVTVSDINGCTATDDINVYTYDVAPVSLNTPVSECVLSDAETVSIDVINSSQDTLLNGDRINVSYVLNSGSSVDEYFNLSDSLKPGETVSYTFTQKADLSANQEHQFDLFAERNAIDVETDDDISVNVDYLTPDYDLGSPVTEGGTEYTIDAGAGFASYLWFDNTTTTRYYTVDINEQNPNNYYAVVVTTTDGCTAEDSIMVTFTTVADLSITDMFSPTESKCWNSTEEDSVHIEITNVGVINLPAGKSFTVGYLRNNGNKVTETFNLSTAMNANDTREYVFDKFTYPSAGNYKFKPFVKYSEDDDASNDTLPDNQSYTITISQPEVDFVGQSDTIYFDEGDTYEIQVNGSYLEYEWSTGATTASIVVTDEGGYTVTVTDQYQCQAEGTFWCLFNDDTGFDNIISGDGYTLSYYPNPATDKVMVEFDNRKPANVRIEIVGINGQLLFNTELKDIKTYLESIDVNKYANGIYYLRFNINGDFYTRKLIVQ